MAKNVLSLSYKDALDYFMSAPNYSTLELSEYPDLSCSYNIKFHFFHPYKEIIKQGTSFHQLSS